MILGSGIVGFGVLLLATTPNHPGTPADPALHPAIHLVLGAFGVIAGGLLIASEVRDDCMADHPDVGMWGCRCDSCSEERWLDKARRTEEGATR